MRYLLLLFICLLGTSSLQAQSGARPSGLFMVDANHRHSGWLIGLGTTKLFAQSDFDQRFLALADSSEAGSYLGSFDPKGKFGFHLELGMFWITEQSFFDYVDLQLGYSQHRGEERYSALLDPGTVDSLATELAGEGSFGQDKISLGVNFNKAIPIKDYIYGIAAIGADLNYRIISDHEYFGSYPTLNAEPSPDAFNMHVHVKAGVGFKTSASSWLSLTAETPIETLVPFDGLVSRSSEFNSKYRPVTFSLRYQWLRKRPSRECPTGPKQNGKKKKRRKGGGRGTMREGQI